MHKIVLNPLQRYWMQNHTQWLNQPDNWGTTKSKMIEYAKRFNEYGQQYAAIEGKFLNLD